jgi:hypothetical protein
MTVLCLRPHSGCRFHGQLRHARGQRTMRHPDPTQHLRRGLCRVPRSEGLTTSRIDKLVAVDKVNRVGVVPVRRVSHLPHSRIFQGRMLLKLQQEQAGSLPVFEVRPSKEAPGGAWAAVWNPFVTTASRLSLGPGTTHPGSRQRDLTSSDSQTTQPTRPSLLIPEQAGH